MHFISFMSDKNTLPEAICLVMVSCGWKKSLASKEEERKKR